MRAMKLLLSLVLLLFVTTTAFADEDLRAPPTLRDAAKAHFGPVLARRPVGLTLQVDVGAEVFDAKFGNLHPLFNKT